MFEDVFLIRGLQMRLPGDADRSVICPSFGTNTRTALWQQTLRKRLVDFCFSELCRDFNGLIFLHTSPTWEWN